MKILIFKYYSSILSLMKYTGMGLTNEHSRAVFIFTLVFFCLIGLLLNLLRVNLTKEYSLFIFVMPISFLIFYKIFTNENVKSDIDDAYNRMNSKNKYLTNSVSLIFTIITPILFIKTSL